MDFFFNLPYIPYCTVPGYRYRYRNIGKLSKLKLKLGKREDDACVVLV